MRETVAADPSRPAFVRKRTSLCARSLLAQCVATSFASLLWFPWVARAQSNAVDEVCQQLLANVQSADRTLSSNAIARLEQEPIYAARILPLLLAPLANGRFEPRGETLRAIGVAREDRPDLFVALLLNYLSTNFHQRVRCNAIEQIEHLGPKGADALPLLVRYATNGTEDKKVRLSLVSAILSIAKENPSFSARVLAPLLNDHDPEIRYEICFRLSELGENAEAALPALRKIVDSDADERMRRKAKNAEGWIALRSRLMSDCKGTNPTSRADAQVAICHLARNQDTDFLVTLLKEPSLRVVSASIEALTRLKGTNAAPAILPVLSHTNREVRLCAIDTLGALSNGVATAALITFLSDSLSRTAPARAEKWQRIEACHAIDALGNMPDVGRTPVLMGILSKHPDVRTHILDALAKTRDPQCVPAVRPFLFSKERATRLAANNCLHALGYTSTNTAEMVMSYIIEGQPSKLAAIGPIATDMITSFMTATNSANNNDQAVMATALGMLGDKRAVPSLIARLSYHGICEPTEHEETSIIDALVQIGDPRSGQAILDSFEERHRRPPADPFLCEAYARAFAAFGLMKAGPHVAAMLVCRPSNALT